MKKLISILTCICVLVCSCSLIVKAKNNFISSVEVINSNEYDIFKEYSDMSDKELFKEGKTQDEIDYIRNFNFEDAIRHRANLPDETLKAYGYSDGDIAELREIASDKSISESAIRSISNITLKSYLRVVKYGTYNNGIDGEMRYVLMAYKFQWNRVPYIALTDCVAISYSLNTGEYPIYQPVYNGGDIIASDYSRYKLKLNMYDGETDTNYTLYEDWEPLSNTDGVENTVSVKFDVGSVDHMPDIEGNMREPIYCQSGSGWFRIAYFNETALPYFNAVYGHSIIDLTPQISISGVDIVLSLSNDEQRRYGHLTSALTVDNAYSHSEGFFGYGDDGYKTYLET